MARKLLERNNVPADRVSVPEMGRRVFAAQKEGCVCGAKRKAGIAMRLP
jgi:hypothetical protein